jgi:hypothetical protein
MSEPINPECAVCGTRLWKAGKNPHGAQVYRCPQVGCGATGTLLWIEELGRRHREKLRQELMSIFDNPYGGDDVAAYKRMMMAELENEVDALRAENKRLREALEFYARADNYEWHEYPGTGGQNSDGSYQEPLEFTYDVWIDHGGKAQKALKALKEMTT